ncbi:hypothetical protein GCM10020367_61760 [Streptomyces sannanensis]|uniref:Uncharacterized protein n=1 Tax=Streptomyces sannanensis TaxID=285536 RepID=A0ABP6SL00_9ACTN
MDTVLYSAELVLEDGEYKLVVKNHIQDTVQVAYVAKKAVEKLPMFLSMLHAKQLSGCR